MNTVSTDKCGDVFELWPSRRARRSRQLYKKEHLLLGYTTARRTRRPGVWKLPKDLAYIRAPRFEPPLSRDNGVGSWSRVSVGTRLGGPAIIRDVCGALMCGSVDLGFPGLAAGASELSPVLADKKEVSDLYLPDEPSNHGPVTLRKHTKYSKGYWQHTMRSIDSFGGCGLSFVAIFDALESSRA
ncbi:hypothetical protein Scep_023139 [Stephania cephalantha]|uniref:Uncharacterized protein n=1 Tax=Stephania cephalantha TaxID=152367 RepID=A0AAP0EUM1_9MAGN